MYFIFTGSTRLFFSDNANKLPDVDLFDKVDNVERDTMCQTKVIVSLTLPNVEHVSYYWLPNDQIKVSFYKIYFQHCGRIAYICKLAINHLRGCKVACLSYARGYWYDLRQPPKILKFICITFPLVEMHTVQWNVVSMSYPNKYQRVIKRTKVLAVIKRMSSRDKDQTWKTEIHNKEHRVTNSYIQQ